MNADTAYEQIRGRIFSLELDPGTPIDEVSLARQVGMPPGPVHEAMEKLIVEGWLERTGDSVKVTQGTLVNFFDQLFEVRSVLEALCARLAAERATPEQLASLEAMMPQFEETARNADNESWLRLDQRFHEAIYAATGNVFLENTLKQIYILHVRIWYIVLHRMTNLPRIVEGHRAIVNALKERDARAAERAFTKHIQESQEMVLPSRI